MRAKLIALLLHRRWIIQERFLFGGDTAPKSLLVEPVHDRLGINFRSNSDDPLKDKSPDRDLPRGTRTSLGVILNGRRSRLYRKAEGHGPGFGRMHWDTSAAERHAHPPRRRSR